MEKTGAEILLQTLKDEGVEVIFGYPGASSLPIHDKLDESPIRHYLVRHEQAAAHAADGYARAAGKVGVCLGTSGPGATNLVTGIATAYMDSTPMIILTGQVTTDLLGSDAFQETDIIGITMPITKHSYLIRDPGKIKSTVKQAFEIARSGRPGPVLIDLPRNVMAAKCKQNGNEDATAAMPKKRHVEHKKDNEDLQRIANYMNMSERPVILVGGGVKLARACDELTGLITKGSIPFVSTMMGIGSVRSSNGFNLGFIGTHGNALANRIVHDADFILTVGARFSDRSTSIVKEFAPLATIAQIDIDPSSIGKVIKADISLVCDIHEALTRLAPLVEGKDRSVWLKRIETERNILGKNRSMKECGPAGTFIRDVQAAMPGETTAITDVGLNQIWTVRSWETRTPRGMITPGGLGTMGFGLPASIGVTIGAPDHGAVVFSGDGGFFMNIQELATISYYNLPIKIVVFNNGHLGMIRQIQDLFYGSRFNDIELGNKVDIVAVAKGFGLEADRVSVEDPGAGIEKMCGAAGPFLLEVIVDPDDYVYPIIPPGRSNIDMIGGRQG
ncbi:MAG: biosynthetic-type acetolactate synthase large subunit [Thermodesulfobacteriota bacterium]|nr:biosynthetic-type acetolactate synthase large subunit [Thermodesulfobacteriota bacterium]